MKRHYNLSYYFSEGFHSIFTHGLMSFAAVFMIVACLIIMGSFSLVALNLENKLGDLERDNEFLAFVDESYSREDALALQTKLITGEVHPSGGRIMVNGYNLNSIRPNQIPYMRRTLGVIFQDFRLIDKKTVWENLTFAMRAVGASPREIRKRIPYVLDLVGLSRKEDRYPTQLSGGEQQRVAIARALVNNPQMIIADEPTGNLDPQRSLEIMMLLEKINELGTTMLVVTHEKELVNRFSKRVIAIEGGRIISDETGGYYNNEETL